MKEPSISFGRTLLLSDPTNGIRAYLGGQTTVSGVMAEAETWYHVAMVVTEGGSEDTITFYIDGVQSGTPAQVDSEDSEGDYLIATNKGLNGRWINGLVDDFRLYNHALSEAEVLAAMGHIHVDLEGQQTAGFEFQGVHDVLQVAQGHEHDVLPVRRDLR